MSVSNQFKPPSELRIWIDGSYKDGFIGYGIVMLPGYRELFGGQAGQSAQEAERLAADKAIESIPDETTCTIYCDYLPLVDELNARGDHITAYYMNNSDPRHRQAHDLANKGRQSVSGEVKTHKYRGDRRR